MSNEETCKYKYKTISVGAGKFFVDKSIMPIVEDIVVRMHKITMLTTELMNVHIVRCLEQNIPLPVNVDNNWVKTNLMMQVTQGNGTLKNVDSEVVISKSRMDPFTPINRTGLDNIMMNAASQCATNFATNVKTHFRKRIQKYVFLTFNPKDGTKMKKSEYKKHKLNLYRVANDLCKPADIAFESDPKFHAWVVFYRSIFKLDILCPDKPLLKHLKEKPVHFLPAMRIMNMAFEGNGKHCISLTPLRRQFRPAFCGIDVKGLQQAFNLKNTEYNKERNRRAVKRRNLRKIASTRSLKKKSEESRFNPT